MGSIGCAAVAGAASNAVSYAISAAQSGSFSSRALLQTTVTGAAEGAAFDGLGKAVSPALGSMLSEATEDAPEEAGATADATGAAGGGSRPFVMGIKDHLSDFAQTHGGFTWKSLPESQLPGDAWKGGVMRMLSNPDQRVLFNLDGVDVWPGVTRAASGGGGATDWELLQIRYGDFPNLEFWQRGGRAGNPFG